MNDTSSKKIGSMAARRMDIASQMENLGGIDAMNHGDFHVMIEAMLKAESSIEFILLRKLDGDWLLVADKLPIGIVIPEIGRALVSFMDTINRERQRSRRRKRSVSSTKLSK